MSFSNRNYFKVCVGVFQERKVDKFLNARFFTHTCMQNLNFILLTVW